MENRKVVVTPHEILNVDLRIVVGLIQKHYCKFSLQFYDGNKAKVMCDGIF